MHKKIIASSILGLVHVGSKKKIKKSLYTLSIDPHSAAYAGCQARLEVIDCTITSKSKQNVGKSEAKKVEKAHYRTRVNKDSTRGSHVWTDNKIVLLLNIALFNNVDKMQENAI